MDYEKTTQEIWDKLPGRDWSSKSESLKTFVNLLWAHRKATKPRIQRVVRTDAEIISAAVGQSLTAIRLKQAKVCFGGGPVLFADVIATTLSPHHPEHERACAFLAQHGLATREERLNRRGRPVTKLVSSTEAKRA
jgi:hypothetical protein